MEEQLNDEKMLVDDEANQSDDVISGCSTLCKDFLNFMISAYSDILSSVVKYACALPTSAFTVTNTLMNNPTGTMY